MTVGIVGLGLIGGSLAKAYTLAGAHVIGTDIDKSILTLAQVDGAIQGELTADTLPTCSLLLIAVYPQAAIDYMKENACHISPDTLVVDCCGTKTAVCQEGFALANAHGYTFVGGHPMAGTHHSGFSASRANLFQGACMVIVPPVRDDISLLSRVKELLAPAGFGRFSVTTAQEHDRIIAFTSQMAHAVSSAYIQNPTARMHKGFSAGSYRDLTRVAWLSPSMWSELFIENSAFLCEEIDCFLLTMQRMRDAIARGDRQALYDMLAEGSRIKKEVDG